MENYKQIIEEAQRVLEESRKWRQYYESPPYRRKMRKLYSNRRAMKKMIRTHENILAERLANRDQPIEEGKSVPPIEWVIEMFMTWRLKLNTCPETMWCDGIEELQLMQINKRTYWLQAKIWIGPERDVGIQYRCDLAGTVILSQNQQRLKGYHLVINDNERWYLVRKAT